LIFKLKIAAHSTPSLHLISDTILIISTRH
jgi:hypothetical protein